MLTDCINSPRFQGISGGMFPQKILKLLQSSDKQFPASEYKRASFLFKKIWVLVKFWFISHTINSCKQWTIIILLLKLHTFPREQIVFLSMALFKPVASSSEKKVAVFSEQCSRRVSSVVAAYWNPCFWYILWLHWREFWLGSGISK